MLPRNWRFREIIINNNPQLILEHYSNNNWIRQYTFNIFKEFKIGDEIKNKKTQETGIIQEICKDKIIIKKSRFEITITNDEIDDWIKN